MHKLNRLLKPLLKLRLLDKYKSKIILFAITWHRVVTIYHKRYIREIGIPLNVEAYVQSRVLKKTLESISFDRRLNFIEENELEKEVEEAVKKLSMTYTGPTEIQTPQEISK